MWRRVGRALGLAAALLCPFVALGQENKPDPGRLDSLEYGHIIEKGTPIEVERMLQIWASRLNTIILVDPTLAGAKIKFLQSDVTLTWGLFKEILKFNDIVIEERESDGRWLAKAAPRRLLQTSVDMPKKLIAKGEPLPTREEVVTAVIQISNGSGQDIYANLRGLLGQRDLNHIGNMLFVKGPEVILIVDFASNVAYYTKVIQAMDIRAPGQITKVLTTNFAPPEDVVRVVQQLLHPGSPSGPPGMPGGPTTSSQPVVVADPRTNKIFVQALPYQIDEITWAIAELDIKATPKGPSYHKYKCKNAEADYLASKLQELLGAGGGGAAAHKPGASARPGSPPGSPAPPAPAGFAGGGAGAATPAKADLSSVETRIVADERTNSLLIQAEEPLYQRLLSLLEGSNGTPGLDSPLRLVFIEAQIWEVTTPTDNMTIGFELTALQNTKQGEFRPLGGTSFGLSSVGLDPTTGLPTRTPNLDASGLLGILSKDSFAKLPIIMQAVASLEHTRLVTTPFALTNDGEHTTFTAGQKIAYSNNSVGGGAAAIAVQTGVAFLDVSTTLDVTPTVNSDDNLTLEVGITIASPAGQGGPGLPPTTNNRSYNGKVTVPNMRYVVFGGLESDFDSWSETKVPYLGDIPILGHLFKRKDWARSKAKIYIFLRPTIITNTRSIEALSTHLREQAHVEAERTEWLPPIATDRLILTPWKTAQDRSVEVFGTGSANPFGRSADD
jgi:general secretion pathway protein D